MGISYEYHKNGENRQLFPGGMAFGVMSLVQSPCHLREIRRFWRGADDTLRKETAHDLIAFGPPPFRMF